MAEAQTTNAKYVFVDVVGFTENRSVEAQTDIIEAMNSAVRTALQTVEVTPERTLLIPTGDGLCVAMLDILEPYDVHLRLAEEIIRNVEEQNKSIEDTTRQYALRVGVSSNTDNIVIDINESKNVAGAGISTAQRVMSLADGGQVIVSQSVYDILSQREAYWAAFREYSAQVKHGKKLSVYQYVSGDDSAIDTSEPSAFQKPAKKKNKLSEFAACYLAEAIEHETEVLRLRDAGGSDYALAVTLYYRAYDRVEIRNASPYDPPTLRARPKDASFKEQFEYYDSQEFWLYAELSRLVTDKELAAYWECFDGPLGARPLFASSIGRERLQNEWPDISPNVNEGDEAPDNG